MCTVYFTLSSGEDGRTMMMIIIIVCAKTIGHRYYRVRAQTCPGGGDATFFPSAEGDTRRTPETTNDRRPASVPYYYYYYLDDDDDNYNDDDDDDDNITLLSVLPDLPPPNLVRLFRVTHTRTPVVKRVQDPTCTVFFPKNNPAVVPYIIQLILVI